MNLTNFTLKEASKKLQSKEISSLELTTAYIESSKKLKPLNIYITETFEQALKQAAAADARYSKGQPLSPIDGIPIGVKDIFLTKGIKTTNASKFLSNFIAPYESTVTNNLLNAGYVCLGKINMDEFAMGSDNLSSFYGAVINPWVGEDKKERVAGGSSGGSAAGVAAKAFCAALGTDTGGSIRQPASFTGTVGLKPTYGTCSRYGIVAFASSLDQAGPITRTVTDNAMLLQHMAGYDNQDSSMKPFQTPNYASKIGKSIKGLKIGLVKEYLDVSLPECVKKNFNRAIKFLQEEGAEIVEVSLPRSKYALPIYYIIAPAEASSNLARFDGVRYGNRAKADNIEDLYFNSRGEGWGFEVKLRVLVGTYNLLHENFGKFIHATKVRRLITEDFSNAFKKVDAILTPTTNSEAFPLHEKVNNSIERYFSDFFTVTANLTGLPAINIPMGLSDNNLPLGIQLIGNYYEEPELYQIAYMLEQKADFKLL
ncbi:Glutamyl-tRNA(Gln) amidotransferase subunit A [Candidatus Hepatincola sp. Av]